MQPKTERTVKKGRKKRFNKDTSSTGTGLIDLM